MSVGLMENHPTAWNGEMVHNALFNLLEDVDWGEVHPELPEIEGADEPYPLPELENTDEQPGEAAAPAAGGVKPPSCRSKRTAVGRNRLVGR